MQSVGNHSKQSRLYPHVHVHCAILLRRSLELARCSKLLSSCNVYLSPSIKPAPKEMADIVKCSGGEVLTTLPHPPGVGVLIVASQDDLSMLSGAVEAGVPVHSTELILGGVLRQELDLKSYPDCYICTYMSTVSWRFEGSSPAQGSSFFSEIRCLL